MDIETKVWADSIEATIVSGKNLILLFEHGGGTLRLEVVPVGTNAINEVKHIINALGDCEATPCPL